MSENSDLVREMLLSGQFSDMEIICQDVIFKAHRAIVCTQSRFFYSALCDGYKESLDRSINLKDETPETIERLLFFLYLGEYQDDGHAVLFQPTAALLPSDDSDSVSQGDSGGPDNMKALKARALNNILVFAAADKFGIDPLKNLASEKFSKWASENWESVIFPEIVEEALVLIPTHETKLQKIIAVIISNHLVDFIDRSTILPVLSSFGCLGSLVILDLVQKRRVIQPDRDDVFQGFSQKLNSSHYCRYCPIPFNVRIEKGDLQNRTFHCAACNNRQ